MKCEKHRDREAIGYCSACAGFGCDLCLVLATDEKWYCQDCLEKLGKARAQVEDQEMEPEATDGEKVPPGEKIAIQKMVVHYMDGRIVKGVAYKLEEKLPGFYLVPRGAKTEEEIFIRFDELKAVFLVRDFDGTPTVKPAEKEFIPEGHEITVYFKDGEILEGYALGEYSPANKRFHVIPRDPVSNNISVLVERANAAKIELGKVFKIKEIIGLFETPVKRLLLCYYWDNLGKITTVAEIAAAIERTEAIVKRDMEVFFRERLMRKIGEPPNQKVMFVRPPDEEASKLLGERVEEMRKSLPRK